MQEDKLVLYNMSMKGYCSKKQVKGKSSTMYEFNDLPSRLEEWTYETVKNLVKTCEFEPGAFDYKDVLNPTGNDKQGHLASIRRTACSMANTSGGFILFGIKDRKVVMTAPEDRITGISLGGDLLREFGTKVEILQPDWL